MDFFGAAIIRVPLKEIAPMETTPQTAAAPQPQTSPALHLTAAAVAQVKNVIAAQGFEGYFLSIRVVPAGCSGFGYDLNLVKDAKADDLTWVQDGINVLTDALSTKYLGGTEVDYVVGETCAGFKFENPNAKSSCGCGTSFST
jgi:iron-sulfur cluster assembly protein